MKQKNWKMVEVTLVSKQLFGDLDFEDDFSSEDITCAIEKDAGFYGPFSRICQPVEELWLLESSDLNISDDLIVDATDSNSMSQYIHSPENKIHVPYDVHHFIWHVVWIPQRHAFVFVQYHVRAHVELMWLLRAATPISWLNRMIQFKEKLRKAVRLYCWQLNLYNSSFAHFSLNLGLHALCPP